MGANYPEKPFLSEPEILRFSVGPLIHTLSLKPVATVANLPPKSLILLASAPRAGARHLRSRAANGKTPGRHDDRSATLSLDWDRGRRVTPADNRVPGSASPRTRGE